MMDIKLYIRTVSIGALVFSLLFGMLIFNNNNAKTHALSIDIQKEIDQASLHALKEKMKIDYRSYRDFKIKEYSYLPKSLLDINLFLPVVPNIDQIRYPQKYFNYEIAQKAIDQINSNNPEHFYHNSFDIDATLSAMSLDEKVRQLFIWNVNGLNPESYSTFVKSNKPGGLILMGGSIGNNLTTITKTIQSSLTIPTLIAIDQEGGYVSRIKSDTFPYSSILQNASISSVESAFEKRSAMLKNDGINLNFGIVADITNDPLSFMIKRVFGGNPIIASKLVAAAVNGTTSTLATLKHFPGHGKTQFDSHKSIPTVDLTYEEWIRSDAIPFEGGINGGIQFVMMGHLIYKDVDLLPASLSLKWHDILRNNLHFNGVIVTDDLKMLVTTGYDPYDAISKAVSAQNDMLLVIESKVQPFHAYETVKKLVESGKVSNEQINQSVKRILEAKKKTLYL